MSPDLLSLLLDALADRLAVRLGSSRERETYTSLDLPPHTSRRRFRELAPRIEGAVRQGRIWIVPRAAWDAHRARRRGMAPAASAASTAPSTPDATADRLLARAGLRVVGGSR